MSMTVSSELQTQLTRFKTIAGAALLVAIVALILALKSRVPSVNVPSVQAIVESGEFAVRDEDGNLRSRLAAQGLTFVDREGRMRAGVSMSDNEAPNLVFLGKNGKVRLVVGIGADDTPGVTLHDQQGRVRVRVGVAL